VNGYEKHQITKGLYTTILLLLSPVFISYGNGKIGFDRVGGILSEYIVSIPIGVVGVFLIAISRFRSIYINMLLVSALVILSTIISFIYHQQIDFSKIRTGLYMIFFIFSLGVFDSYFKKIIHLHPDYIISVLRNSVSMIIIIVIASSYIFGKGVFVFYPIKIYNYEQYFALFFIAFMGLYFEKKVNNKLHHQILYFTILLWIGSSSSNLTAQILYTSNFLIFIFLYSNSLRVKFTEMVVIANAAIFLASPILMLYSTDVINIQAENFLTRVQTMSFLFENINSVNFILPFLSEPRPISNDYHNEFIETLFCVGWLGVIIYYKIILTRIFIISKCFPYIAVSLSTLIFIGGIVVENTHHPYMAICIALCLSFFSHYAKITRHINK